MILFPSGKFRSKVIGGIIILLLIIQLIGPIAPAIGMTSPMSINTTHSVPKSVLAQSSNILAQANRGSDWEPPEREVREGFWAWLRGLGRRGPCSDLDPPLIALVPALPSSLNHSSNLSGSESIQLASDEDSINLEFAGVGVARSLSEHPSFWFYIPSQAQDAETVEFMIQDAKGDDLLDEPIHAHLRAGLVNLQVPESSVAFEINQPYHWYFSVICDADRPSRNIHVDGWTVRVNPVDLGIDPSEIRQLSLQDQLDRYSSVNIWHETVELLANEQCSNTSESVSIAEYWDTLLDDILPGVGRDWINPRSYCAHPEPLDVIAGVT